MRRTNVECEMIAWQIVVFDYRVISIDKAARHAEAPAIFSQK